MGGLATAHPPQTTPLPTPGTPPRKFLLSPCLLTSGARGRVLKNADSYNYALGFNFTMTTYESQIVLIVVVGWFIPGSLWKIRKAKSEIRRSRFFDCSSY